MNIAENKKNKTFSCRNVNRDILGGRSNLINDIKIGLLLGDIIENFQY